MAIGFRLTEYAFQEPSTPIRIRNVTLIKEDSRTSEQTFTVFVNFSDPGNGVSPASLQQESGQVESSDYVVTTPGRAAITKQFLPNQQEITIEFTLLPDNILEGVEGFRATVQSAVSSPTFQLPVSNAFPSTLIKINDSEYNKTCKIL